MEINIHIMPEINKCEWKQETRKHFMKGTGYFPCKGFYKIHGDETPIEYGWKFCPYCGSNIKIPKSIIKKTSRIVEYIE